MSAKDIYLRYTDANQTTHEEVRYAEANVANAIEDAVLMMTAMGIEAYDLHVIPAPEGNHVTIQ